MTVPVGVSLELDTGTGTVVESEVQSVFETPLLKDEDKE